MGLEIIEDIKYTCDLCGKTRLLSDIYGDHLNDKNDEDMYTITINKIEANNARRSIGLYQNGIRALNKNFIPKEIKQGKHIVCEDCFKSIKDLYHDNGSRQTQVSNVTNTDLLEYSIRICDLVEDLLESKNITIPNDDRLGDEDEARLYGDDYYHLENQVMEVLSDVVNKNTETSHTNNFKYENMKIE